MVPQTKKRPKNSSRVNLVLSLIFHGALALVAAYFAAREGLLGKQIKKIAVEMVAEKKVEQPKPPEKPKIDVPPPEAPKVVVKTEAPQESVQKPVAPPPSSMVSSVPAAVAPAATDVPSFTFGGGKNVETSSDPSEVYRGYMQYALQSRWNRPEDIDDAKFVALVEVTVSPTGEISNPVWKKNSGNKRWDNSVAQALASTTQLDRSPPPKFPNHVTIRFDVAETENFNP